MRDAVSLGAMAREAVLEVMGLSWAHTEKEEGSPVEQDSIRKEAELRICVCHRGL